MQISKHHSPTSVVLPSLYTLEGRGFYMFEETQNSSLGYGFIPEEALKSPIPVLASLFQKAEHETEFRVWEVY